MIECFLLNMSIIINYEQHEGIDIVEFRDIITKNVLDIPKGFNDPVYF